MADCSDNLTQGEFDYRLAAFDRDYGDLLQDLDALDGHPQDVVLTSYDALRPDPGPPGLDPKKIELWEPRSTGFSMERLL